MSLTLLLACMALPLLFYYVWQNWQLLTTSPLHALTRLLHKLFLFKERNLLSSASTTYGTHCSPEARALFSMVSLVAIDDSEPTRPLQRMEFVKMRQHLNFMMSSVLSKAKYEWKRTSSHDSPIRIKVFSRPCQTSRTKAHFLKSLWIYQDDENHHSHLENSTTTGITNSNTTSSHHHHHRKTLIYFHGGGYYFGSPEAYSGFFIPFARKYGINVYLADYILSPDQVEHSFREIFTDAYEELNFVFRELKLRPQDVCLGGDSAGGNLVLNLMRMMSLNCCSSSSSSTLEDLHSVQLNVDTLEDLHSFKYSELSKFLILSPWCDLEMTHASVFEKDNRNEMMLSRNLLLKCREGKVPFESDPSEFSVLKFSRNVLKQMLRNKKILLNWGDCERLREEIEKFAKILRELKEEEKMGMEFIELVGRDMCHDYPFLFNYELPEAIEALDRFAEFVKSD
ncbi:hypothetical protein FDP41_008546 [Naegleria fowleri]|uniref:Alpha/beta hydrolase fold-3 domain-containing protein n=1 Tax=Naegleria fowleri TaxID=5763 RepID=A0A6A5BKG0_NAEFO|nr:uncharacterized protein FDP41_008546 [Naegleria fowleri]KAF0973339.1 hypothetical protein FDP41_008546 [Naegleria fowleri]CAG4710924.1 unnamed protein product [Naegleria fowleri]